MLHPTPRATVRQMAKTDAVAKLRIAVLRNGTRWNLMSRKRKRDTADSNHDKLEMLGGHLDGEESPRQALVRECREEEATGRLAAWVEQRRPPFATKIVDGAAHHLFELTLSDDEAAGLIARPEESLGFRLVNAEALDDGELTYRTGLILRAFAQPGPGQLEG